MHYRKTLFQEKEMVVLFQHPSFTVQKTNACEDTGMGWEKIHDE
jgi:hypothetical protein